ncbi:MATE family efflux transporter [Chondrinema litorale]|uniref:MATE family efflux transporter n=1 Tax=Chondrinema litorale TaxID=2994555 RepID=UPI002543C677|nr:MATE family efflux transporter [Chondrinema litorale]UZR92578.1 MATE family efflux transporter [Chondrinema litorale]
MITNLKQISSKVDKAFLKKLIHLALPISLQQMLTASFSLVDVAMVGQLGTIQLAAVGLVSKSFFVSIHILGGLASGAGILAAQYFGKKDKTQYISVLLITLTVSLLFTIPLIGIAFFYSEEVMHLLSDNPAIIAEGEIYIKTSCLFHMLTGIVLVYGAMLRSIHHSILPMIAGLIGIILNTFLNYLLIFGHFGFSAMGVKGAAIATVLSKCLELAILLLIIHYKKYPLIVNHLYYFKESFVKKKIKLLLKTASPIVMSELSWSMGVFAYYIIYGYIGANELAAMSMLEPLEGIFIQFFVGFGAACTIILGNQLGAEKPEEAFKTAKLFMLLIPLGGIAAGILLISCYPLAVLFFDNISDEALALSRQIILLLGCMMFLKLFNMTTMFGILRSGGDTKYIFMIDLVTMWGVGVPLAFITAFILEWPLIMVLSMLVAEETVKMIWSMYRVNSGKWLNNLVS